jgi:hypothetical protein
MEIEDIQIWAQRTYCNITVCLRPILTAILSFAILVAIVKS